MKDLFIDLGLGFGISIVFAIILKSIEKASLETDIESVSSIEKASLETDIESVSFIEKPTSSQVVYNNYRTQVDSTRDVKLVYGMLSKPDINEGKTLPTSRIGYYTKIEDIPRLKRWANALGKEGIYTVSDLINRADGFFDYSVKEIYSYDGIGKVGITKIQRFLKSYTGNYYRCPTKKPTYWSF